MHCAWKELLLTFLKDTARVEWSLCVVISKLWPWDITWGFLEALSCHLPWTILMIRANHNEMFLNDECIILYIFHLYEKFSSFILLSTCIRRWFRFLRQLNFIWLHIFNGKKPQIFFIWQGWGEGWLPFISEFSVCVAFDTFLTLTNQHQLTIWIVVPPKWNVYTHPAM